MINDTDATELMALVLFRTQRDLQTSPIPPTQIVLLSGARGKRTGARPPSSDLQLTECRMSQYTSTEESYDIKQEANHSFSQEAFPKKQSAGEMRTLV